MIFRKALLAAGFASLLRATIISAATIDDFEWSSNPPEPLVNGPGWERLLSSKPGAEAVIFDGGRRLRIPGSGSSGYANHTKPTQFPNNSTGTLTFRFHVPVGFSGDVSVGLANPSAIGAGSSLSQAMAGTIRFTTQGNLHTFDGSTSRTFDQSIQPGVWYEVAMQLNSSADRWSATITGGAYSLPQTLTSDSGLRTDFAFRGSTGTSSLSHFAIRTNAAHGTGSELFLDDIRLELYETAPMIWDEKAEGYQGIWFTLGQFSTHGDKYSGGLGTYTAQHNPIAIYAPEVNKTFFVYGGSKNSQRYLLLMAGSYDHATGEVTRPTIVYDKGGVDDPHDNPAISIDAAGHIWVFVAGRNTSRPGVVLKSVSPYSTDAFVELFEFSGMTYPQPFYDVCRAQFALLFTRYTNGRELYFATSSDGLNWSPQKKLAGFGGHYQVGSFNPATGKIGTFFNYHPGGNVDGRTNVYYMESIDFGQTWTNAAGIPLTTPLDTVSNPALVENLAAQNLLMYNCDLNWDTQGNPLLLYIVPRDFRPGPDGDPREWRLTRWTGTQWVTSIITTSSHAYDMGSLYVADDRWTVIGPTGIGPQPWGTGGEMEVWTTDDQGDTWVRQRAITQNSLHNHSYARRPLHPAEPFFALWADGNPDTLSQSSLYFTNQEGTRHWRLPYNMSTDTAAPEEIHPPFERWVSAHFSQQEIADGILTAPLFDADADGQRNLLEHAFGTSPRVPDEPPIRLDLHSELDGTQYLAIEFTRAVDAADVEISADVSNDLETWHSGAGYTQEISRTRFNTPSGEKETVRVRDAIPLHENSRRFIRLRVVRRP